jgi:hypothetical protein
MGVDFTSRIYAFLLFLFEFVFELELSDVPFLIQYMIFRFKPKKKHLLSDAFGL